MAMVRQPAVSGKFYPSSPKELRKEIKSLLEETNGSGLEAVGCVLPHAGYAYSGAVACSVVARLKLQDNIIILGPNHTGLGEAFSIMAEGSWNTPLGEITINTRLAAALLKNSPLLRVDSKAHQFEHSVEVELPILKYFKDDFSFVPMVIAGDDLKSYQDLGRQIAIAVKEAGLEKEILIIASSDMTHYEEEASARAKDSQAIEAIIELDAQKLWSKIGEYSITMCGYAPVIVMLNAAVALGAKKGRLVRYQTSAAVTGDAASVVGYAGIIVN